MVEGRFSIWWKGAFLIRKIYGLLEGKTYALLSRRRHGQTVEAGASAAEHVPDVHAVLPSGLQPFTGAARLAKVL